MGPDSSDTCKPAGLPGGRPGAAVLAPKAAPRGLSLAAQLLLREDARSPPSSHRRTCAAASLLLARVPSAGGSVLCVPRVRVGGAPPTSGSVAGCGVGSLPADGHGPRLRAALSPSWDGCLRRILFFPRLPLVFWGSRRSAGERGSALTGLELGREEVQPQGRGQETKCHFALKDGPHSQCCLLLSPKVAARQLWTQPVSDLTGADAGVCTRDWFSTTGGWRGSPGKGCQPRPRQGPRAPSPRL